MIRNISAGFTPQIGCSLNLLNETNLEQIHAATLEVLEFAGIGCGSKDARDIFKAAGAKVNEDKQMVYIPPYMVEEAIRSAPQNVLMAGRNPQNDVLLTGGKVNFISFGTAVYVLDPYTKECRKATKKDVGQLGLLTDAMDQLDLCFETALPLDVPYAETAIWHGLEAHANNTTKNLNSEITDGWSTEILLEMGYMIAGGKEKFKERPVLTTGGCPISPLTICEGLGDSIILCAKAGAPLLLLSCALAGATSPITIAGTLVQHNAEVLSSIVLAQLVQKGAPVIYGSSTSSLDPRRGAAAVGTPELALISAALVQIARFYNLPSFVAGG